MPLSTRRLSSRWFAGPLIFGVAVLLTLLAATAFLGLRYWHERQAAHVLIKHSGKVLDTLDRLRANIADLESERRGYLLTLDPTYLKPYGVSDESVRREGEALQTLVADDPLQSLRAAHLALIVSAKLREMEDSAKTARTPGLDAALASIRSMDEIRSQIGQMVDHERFVLVDWQRRADALEQSKTWLILATIVIVTVLAGAALALARLEARRRRKGTEENFQLQSGSVALEGRRNEGVAFAVDLTERKRAEEALRERAQLLNLTHDTIFVRNMNDVISFWNRGAEQLYGWNKEEALDQVAHELLRTIFPAPLEKITSELLSTGRWEGELVHIKRDGAQVTVASRWSLRQDERGRPIGIIETNNDVTEQKRAEYLTGHVFQSSPDSMCIIGRDYRLQRVNPVFERFWKKPAAMAVGMHIAEIIGTELFERNAKPSLDRCFAGEEVSLADWYATRLGRRYRVVTHSPLRPDSQRVEAALLIARDFTDYVQASEALRDSQAELAHVNRVATMGQLAASIAHEVNQPIAAAVTNAYAALRWLGRTPPDLEEVRKALDAITKDGIRAGDVISRIRDLIRKAPPRKEGLAINEALLEVIALTRSEAVKHGVSVQTQLADGLPLIQGDRVQLQQVVLNLIINAIEAMSSIGEGSREMLISTGQAEPDGLLVTVRDLGPGLNPEILDQLFDPFYTTKAAGMGMGLSICRTIVEAHGGRLWATANSPKGAVFQFTLPWDQDEAS
jgi:PAS domain S-box-containing protein